MCAYVCWYVCMCVCRGAMCGRCLCVYCTIEEGWGGVAGCVVVAEDGRIGR